MNAQPPRRDPRRPLNAITMGDARGIGPEVVAKALTRQSVLSICSPLVIGDLPILRRTAESLRAAPTFVEGTERIPAPSSSEKIPVLSLSRLAGPNDRGQLSPAECARASFAYVKKAGKMALHGDVDAMVTGPVSKEGISSAGIPFRGHTEYLAEISGTRDFVMMLAGETLRVSLVTTHLPLGEVLASLKEEKIASAIRITGRALVESFDLDAPQIGVAAWNPHAGEGGLFGKEEEMISRAVRKTRDEGFQVSGPWPADTVFHRAKEGEFQAVVCLYHDQGMIPIKLLHFYSAVNVTLGLPFIRTSVDHGVAYDIAGKGQAHSGSMEEAIRLAAKMAWSRRAKT
jgi:4-hydroxythreonine-4-phosphate dehydrogenase